MTDLLTKLLASQKFMVMLAAVIGLIITKAFKVTLDPATITEFVVLVGSWLIGQGISDHGKGAAKVAAIANIQAVADIAPAEKIETIKSV